jgi:hypothetical protein
VNNNQSGLKVIFFGGSLTSKNIPRNMEIDFICDITAGVVRHPDLQQTPLTNS